MPLHECTKAGLPGRAARFAARAVRRGGVLVVALRPRGGRLRPRHGPSRKGGPAARARLHELRRWTVCGSGSGGPQSWLDRASQAGAGIVLLGAGWANIAPARPPAGFDPRDPADPAYSWERLDAAVRDATAQGFKVMILVTRAPPWAEGPDRPDLPVEDLEPGAWKPDPAPSATSRRRSPPATRAGSSIRRIPRRGASAGPAVAALGGAEPRRQPGAAVRGRQALRPEHYRRMLDSFYTAIKAVAPSNTVVTGGPPLR